MRSAFAIDWRDAWRALHATPMVTALAILSLALGIGANTALFSILNGLVLKSLPVREPERLVLLDEGSWTNPIWEEIRSRQDQIADGAFAWSAEDFDVSPSGETDVVPGIMASGRLFHVLGVSALRGRILTEADDVRSGGPEGPVAVISAGFWKRRYGGAEDIIGRRISIERVAFTIVGVAPVGFFGPDVGRSFDVAIPIGTEPLIQLESSLDRRTSWWLNIMLRLKPGQSVADASRQLQGVQAQIREATLPPSRRPEDVAQYLNAPFTVVPAEAGRSPLRGRYQRPLTTIMVVAGIVLVIACANIANLLMGRAAARRRELSLRLALGASRLRLARQLLAESAMLAAVGAVLGLALAYWGSQALVAQLATPDNSVYLDLSLDWRVFGFTLVASGATVLLFGLAPAFSVSGIAPNEALKEQGRVGRHSGRIGFRGALIVMQVALSLALVVAAGLLTRTFVTLVTRDAGFDREAVLIARVDVQRSTVPAERRGELFERFRQAAATVPGVVRASASYTTPVQDRGWNTRIVAAGTSTLAPRLRMAWVNAVSPGWFETFGVRLSAGRDFDDRDRIGAPRVAVVNRAFARRFLSEENPVGSSFSDEGPGGVSVPFEVIGMVEDTVYRSLRAEMAPTMFIPVAQWNQPSSRVAIGLRVAGGQPLTFTKSVAEVLSREAPEAVMSFVSLSDQVDASLSQERLIATLSAFFGSLALLLAGLGLYGVTSYAVNRRRTEIGIRMALGANPTRVVRLVLRRVAWLVAVGLVAGACLSAWASRFIATLLYGLEPQDPLTLAGAAVLLALVAAVAGWLPARRAARIDPTLVLREG